MRYTYGRVTFGKKSKITKIFYNNSIDNEKGLTITFKKSDLFCLEAHIRAFFEVAKSHIYLTKDRIITSWEGFPKASKIKVQEI